MRLRGVTVPHPRRPEKELAKARQHMPRVLPTRAAKHVQLGCARRRVQSLHFYQEPHKRPLRLPKRPIWTWCEVRRTQNKCALSDADRPATPHHRCGRRLGKQCRHNGQGSPVWHRWRTACTQTIGNRRRQLLTVGHRVLVAPIGPGLEPKAVGSSCVPTYLVNQEWLRLHWSRLSKVNTDEHSHHSHSHRQVFTPLFQDKQNEIRQLDVAIRDDLKYEKLV